MTKKEYRTKTVVCEQCRKTVSKPGYARHKRLCKQQVEDEDYGHEEMSNAHPPNNVDMQELHAKVAKMEVSFKVQHSQIEDLKSQMQQFIHQTRKHNKQQLQIHNNTLSTPNATQNTILRPSKKNVITQAMRIVCWNTYIGDEVGKTQCLCCKSNNITQHNFHCGHVVAEAQGGAMHVSNLRPICAVCNNSMGTTNMIEFAKDSFDVDIV
jgi:hypothetical protein